MSSKTEHAPAERATEHRPTTGYVVYHPTESFSTSPLTEQFEELAGPERRHLAKVVDLLLSRDMAAAVRLNNGWSDEAQIIPVQIPAIASTAAKDEDDAVPQDGATSGDEDTADKE